MKRYFIVSDIHAKYGLLMDALKQSNFDTENSEHILVIAGDILDRGDQGDELILFLESLIIKNRLIGVVGNHDVFLIDILNGEYNLARIIFNINSNGFYKTLLLGMEQEIDEFSMSRQHLDSIQKLFRKKYPIFVEWLLNLPIYLEFKNHVIVHAFLDFSLDDWRDTPQRFAVWERRYDDEIPVGFGKTLIFGHTPNKHIDNQNNIIFSDRKIMIDGGAASDCQINVLTLNEDEI